MRPRERDGPGSMVASTTDDSSTELLRARRESADERYRRLLEHSPDAICVHQDGRLVYVNRAGVSWMAADSAEALVGSMITDFVDAASIPAMLDRIAGLRRQGDVSAPSEAVLLKFDGGRLDVEAVSVLTVWNDEPAYQVIFRDLTTQKAAQAALRYQAALVDHVSDAIVATTSDGVVSSWNPAATTIYGRTAREVLGGTVSAAVGAAIDPAKIVAQGGITTETHYDADGSALTVRVSVATLGDADAGYVLLCSDQTALRQAERYFASVVSSLDEGVLVLDHTGAIMSVNPAVHRLLGAAAEKFTVGYRDLLSEWAKHWTHELFHHDGTPMAPTPEAPISVTLRDGAPFSGEARYRTAAGQIRWLAVSSRRLTPEAGERSPVLISLRDITAARNATEKFAHQARHDPLTGLPNRAHLIESVQRLQADGLLSAVLFVDLDDLKRVNDSLGHDSGDVMIKCAAQRLRHAVRKDDVVCRLAGDEFVLLLVGQSVGAELDTITQRIAAVLADPVWISGFSVHMTASIGVVRTEPGDTRDPALLLRLADRAMYAAKARDRQTVILSGTAP